jgi:hypothetical protein
MMSSMHDLYLMNIIMVPKSRAMMSVWDVV